jgi:preprotein translocase subunit SecG
MTSTLLIVQIVLAIAITISVLLQKSSSIGLGAYSGSNESMFGAKGPTGFLAKATFTLAFLFIINTLVLGFLYTKENSKSVVDSIKSSVPVSAEQKIAPSPVAPTAPTAPESNQTK